MTEEPAEQLPEGSLEPAADEAGERGALELREKAVERLVVAAAAEVPDVASPVSRVLGQTVGTADLEGRPKADVRLAGDLVTADLTLSVRWPASVVDVAEQVREHVERRLAELAGLRLGHIDVSVTSLVVDERPRRRVQ